MVSRSRVAFARGPGGFRVTGPLATGDHAKNAVPGHTLLDRLGQLAPPPVVPIQVPCTLLPCGHLSRPCSPCEPSVQGLLAIGLRPQAALGAVTKDLGPLRSWSTNILLAFVMAGKMPAVREVRAPSVPRLLFVRIAATLHIKTPYIVFLARQCRSIHDGLRERLR